MLFRPQRGSLDDSMAQVQPVKTRADIERITGFKVVAIEPYYGFDARIGWDTYIVLTNGRSAIGFTNGPL